MIQPHSDLLSPYVEEVARRCGFYYPFDKKLLRLSQDKKYFKDICEEYGVQVPREYNDENEVFTFPVIVKPVDSCAARGISICNNKKELKAGIEIAKHNSRAGRVIIEDYIDGDEINVTYIAINGQIHLAAIHDRYFSDKLNSSVKMPDLYIYLSRYTELYEKAMNDCVKKYATVYRGGERIIIFAGMREGRKNIHIL